MSYAYLAVIAVFTLFCSLITGRIERIPISGPILSITFGAAVVVQTMTAFDWRILVYAVLSLTVVRMLPVFVSLSGLGLPTQRKLFIGWFGPRGLAGSVFVVIVLNNNLPGGRIMAVAVVCTVVASILAHGFSANPTIAALTAKTHRRSEPSGS